MREAVEECRRHLGIDEHGGPFGEVQVRGDDDARMLVELAQQMEQQRTARLAEWQVAELIEDDDVHAQQTAGDTTGSALSLFLLERIDQVYRPVEAHPLGVLHDPGHTDGGRKMAFAATGPTHQNDVVGRFGERRLGQLRHQLAIDRRDLEVEAGEVAVNGELRRTHLMAHRAGRPIGGLGEQHLLDQPARTVDLARVLLDQIGPRRRHAVQAQRLEFGNDVTHHDRPPGCRAAGRSGRCRRSAASAPAAASARWPAAAARSGAPAR